MSKLMHDLADLSELEEMTDSVEMVEMNDIADESDELGGPIPASNEEKYVAGQSLLMAYRLGIIEYQDYVTVCLKNQITPCAEADMQFSDDDDDDDESEAA